MSMAGVDAPSLREIVAKEVTPRSFYDRGTALRFTDLARGTSLGGHPRELAGRSVLLATESQLTSALALIELEGVARHPAAGRRSGTSSRHHRHRRHRRGLDRRGRAHACGV